MQKLSHSGAALSPPPDLAFQLLRRVARGGRCTEVVSDASAAVAFGSKGNRLASVAKLAKKRRSNVERDLHRWSGNILKHSGIHMRLTFIKLVIRDLKAVF